MQTTKKQPVNLDKLSQSRLCESEKTDTFRPKSLLAGSISTEELYRSILSKRGYTFTLWPHVDGGCITCRRNGHIIPFRFRSFYDILHFHRHYLKCDVDFDYAEIRSIFNRFGI